MLKSHEKFHSANGKRLILVADDEMINRELLRAVLENDYEVIFAADGQETLDQIRQYRDDLSLVLLDLMMPVKSGREVLREMKADPACRDLPVIVLTADQNAEVESLSIGAIDYIPKPYPQSSIILARVLRAIELSEDREIIQSTERDPLTDLYNREYFYRYAEQYDQHHRDREMDAIVVDINHFHMINERFGSAYGDEVLRSVGEKIREAVADRDGIVCRRESDTFMAYCPHGMDYKSILDSAAVGLHGDESVNSRVRLRMGVYANVDKTLDIERRFDRAKMAADTVRNSFTKTIALYNNTLHERELYAEQLIDDFHLALEEQQFQVYYQPKFDIRPSQPVLTSAEALVRWQHPTLGMISPGVFIPLFEDNGLIQQLDSYVWRRTAAQIRDWRDRLGISVPVSVNMSRIDMYDPELLDKFTALLRENGLTADDLLLEITESAYTQDSDQIIETVNSLRAMGFRVEMDDFGTGYSSLNMISSLPIDALKLDMQFIRSAFKDQRDTRMLEVIIDIADHLSVPVIAEGVETEEQLTALRDLGCDIVQGYYFSKPVPAEDFESFLEVRRSLPPEDLTARIFPPAVETVPAAKPHNKTKRAIPLRATNYVFAVLAFLISAVLIATDIMISRSHESRVAADSRYVSAQLAASDLEAASDYLTVNVRNFVFTGDRHYLDNYFEEVNVTRRRDTALADLGALLDETESDAYNSLETALRHSNDLMTREYEAMGLACLAYGIDDLPAAIADSGLSPEDLSLTPEARRDRAIELVFDEEYQSYKEQIRESVRLCTEKLIESASQAVIATEQRLNRLITAQIALMVLLLLAVLGEVIFVTVQVRIPLTRLVSQMRAQKEVPPTGAEELRFVTRAYNEILEENLHVQRQLSYEATHDPLTGLLNRSAYEMFMDNADKERIALLIVDVDKFKSINDTYGHEVGDRLLCRVAEVLTQSFRSVDAVCRLGGDEFVVVMTRVNSSMRQLVIDKIARVNKLLENPGAGLPRASLSVGAAFADNLGPEANIFMDADSSLYRVKKSGGCGCAVYEPDAGTAAV